ncbi:DinB family protein [Pseudomonas shirazensis]
MKTAVQKNIVETFKEFNAILSSFSQEELNIVTFEGSWTGAQTVQHVILVCSGYPELFAGNTKKTTRKPDENIKQIEAIFLDFNTKMDAPEFVRPELIDYNKNSLTLSLLKIESELLNACETFDLTLTCLDFEVPGFEKFTIYEWINFGLIHTKRHTKQLNDILKHITKV